ncbi:uncharacterized protein LOC106672335 [Cimex lectularius]|uniref:Uncharacterized protein n=1 Tax=Cimex lectularius TaxID=79782 RepID=A0A8I6S9P9_CIMLE|nr:uncharacterized protein LOC106672335 [Cimex lectularius]
MYKRRDSTEYCVWSCIVILFVLALVVASQTEYVTGRGGRQVDCMKYVFAPVCRGVAAKKSAKRSTNFIPRLQYNVLRSQEELDPWYGFQPEGRIPSNKIGKEKDMFNNYEDIFTERERLF